MTTLEHRPDELQSRAETLKRTLRGYAAGSSGLLSIAVPAVVAFAAALGLLRAGYPVCASVAAFLCGYLPLHAQRFAVRAALEHSDAARQAFDRSSAVLFADAVPLPLVRQLEIERRHPYAVLDGRGEVHVFRNLLEAGDKLGELDDSAARLCRSRVMLGPATAVEHALAKVWRAALLEPERDEQGHLILGYTAVLPLSPGDPATGWCPVQPRVEPTLADARAVLEEHRREATKYRDRAQLEAARIVALVSFGACGHRHDVGAEYLGLAMVTASAEGGPVERYGLFLAGARLVSSPDAFPALTAALDGAPSLSVAARPIPDSNDCGGSL